MIPLISARQKRYLMLAPRHEILCRERRAKAASSVDLSKAKRVVGVGRGLAAQDDLKMVHELAAVLNAEVGCSRPIAEGEVDGA